VSPRYVVSEVSEYLHHRWIRTIRVEDTDEDRTVGLFRSLSVAQERAAVLNQSTQQEVASC
jgi:hypothetical protein